MKPIPLEICCGTTCYMLGAAQLLRLAEQLPQDWLEHMEITPVPCLDLCLEENLGNAPFVRLNGEIMDRATPERVRERLRVLLGKEVPQ